MTMSSDYYACEHVMVEIRCRVASNGVRHYPKQCLRCGSQVGVVPKNSLSPSKRALLQTWDPELHQRFYAEAYADLQEAWSTKRAEEQAAWWSAYNDYLQSPAWRQRRRMVLERDRYRCMARLRECSGVAEQVHHLSYHHLFNEPLWELQSVCGPCHDTLTCWDRANRAEVLA